MKNSIPIIHRTNGEWRLVDLKTVPMIDAAEWLINPDLSNVGKAPPKHWNVSGNTVVLKPQAERDAIDAAELSAKRDAMIERLTERNSLLRAVVQTLLTELNSRADDFNALKAAIEDNNTLASIQGAVSAIADRQTRTGANLRQAIRNQLEI